MSLENGKEAQQPIANGGGSLSDGEYRDYLGEMGIWVTCFVFLHCCKQCLPGADAIVFMQTHKMMSTPFALLATVWHWLLLCLTELLTA